MKSAVLDPTEIDATEVIASTPVCPKCLGRCELIYIGEDIHPLSACCSEHPLDIGSPTTAIVLAKSDPMRYFAPNGLDPLLNAFRTEVERRRAEGEFEDSPEGRTAGKRVGRQIASMRRRVDEVRLERVRELEELPKRINAEGARFRDIMQQMQDELEAPSKAEEARKEAHKQAISEIREIGNGSFTVSSDVEKRIAEIGILHANRDFDEYTASATETRVSVFNSLSSTLTTLQKQEAQERELEQLRAEKAKRDAEERERKIAEEATARAEATANERIEAAKREAELAKLEAKEKAERDRIAAEERAEQSKNEAIEAERRKAEAERKRIEDEAAAERKRMQDAADALRLEAEAEQRQRDRDAAEVARREADEAHKTSVHIAILEAFKSAGLPEACAIAAGKAIIKGLIPNVKVVY